MATNGLGGVEFGIRLFMCSIDAYDEATGYSRANDVTEGAGVGPFPAFAPGGAAKNVLIP